LSGGYLHAATGRHASFFPVFCSACAWANRQNGIEREMAAGNGRCDLQVEYGDEQYLIELKRNYDSYTREEGLDKIPGICHVLVFLKDI
jgi:hypothetical protein